MGLKFGFAVMAAQKDLFVALAPHSGHPCLYARVRSYFGNNNEIILFLAYPDGNIGVLEMSFHKQLEVAKILSINAGGWCPTRDQMLALLGELPQDSIIFNGKYQVRGNIPSSEFLPEAIHTDQERFIAPRGPWEETISLLLSQELLAEKIVP